MGADHTKQLSSLIWIQTICKSSPKLPISYILITNSIGPIRTNNCLVWSGSKLFATVHLNFLSVTSLCQTAWVQIRPNDCLAWSGSKPCAKVHLKKAWVQIRPNNCRTLSGTKLFITVNLNFLSIYTLNVKQQGSRLLRVQTSPSNCPVWSEPI